MNTARMTYMTIFIRPTPVSYTHLDVYKRQDVNNASAKDVNSPVLDEIGNIKSNVPKSITLENPIIII